MDSMFQQLKKLYDNELWANVIPIVSEMLWKNEKQRRHRSDQIGELKFRLSFC